MASKKSANIFAKAASYLDSDESYLDEYRECSLDHLELLLKVNKDCLAAMNNPAVPDYWKWRVENGLFNVPAHMRLPLDTLKTRVERVIRLLNVAMGEK